MVKRIVVGLFGVILGLIVLGGAAGFLLRDSFAQALGEKIEQETALKVSVGSIDLSLLRSFPLAEARLFEVSVADRLGARLVSLEHVSLAFDLVSLAGSLENQEIKRLSLHRPVIHLVEREDGGTNWDPVLLRNETADDKPSAGALKLERFSIADGTVDYRGQASVLLAKGVDLAAQATLSSLKQVFSVALKVSDVSAGTGTVTYLRNAALGFESDFDFDAQSRTLSVSRGEAKLNDLVMGVVGTLDLAGDVPVVDLEVNTPRNEIKQLLSLAPGTTAQNLVGLRSSGALSLSGKVKGRLLPGQLPRFNLQFLVEDGAFKFSSLPLGVDLFALDASVACPGGDPDSTVADLKSFDFKVGDSRINGRMHLAKVLSDPAIELTLQGDLDLEKLAQAYPLPDYQRVAGRLKTDLTFSARRSHLRAQQYQKVKAFGQLTAQDVHLEPKNGRTVRVALLESAFEPKGVKVRKLEGTVGKSDFSLSGAILDPLGFALSDKVLRGQFALAAKHLDLREFIAEPEKGGAPADDATSSEPVRIPKNVNLRMNATANEIVMEQVTLTGVKASFSVRDQKLEVKKANGHALGGEVGFEGVFDTSPERPTFDFAYDVKKISFKKAFASLRTAKAYAPIAEYIQGDFNSTMAVKGELGEDMLPSLATLSATGVMETLESVIENFKPVNALAATLRGVVPKKLDISNRRTDFWIEEGKVHLKEFPLQAGRHRFQFGGSHGLDRSMNYFLRGKLPTSVLPGKLVGAQAKALGIDLDRAGALDVEATLGGDLQNPKVGLKVLGAGGVAAAVKQAAAQKVQVAAAEARRRAQAEADKILRQAEAMAGNIRAKAKEAASRVRSEGSRAAAAILKKAGQNPIKKIAAKKAAAAVRNESNKKAHALEMEANKRSQKVVSDAQKESKKMLQRR